jgi:hypothetical protein
MNHPPQVLIPHKKVLVTDVIPWARKVGIPIPNELPRSALDQISGAERHTPYRVKCAGAET